MVRLYNTENVIVKKLCWLVSLNSGQVITLTLLLVGMFDSLICHISLIVSVNLVTFSAAKKLSPWNWLRDGTVKALIGGSQNYYEIYGIHDY